MNKENEVKKCKMCGSTLVGKNKIIGLCSNCVRKAGQGGVSILVVGALVVTGFGKFIKAVFKKG